MLKKTFFLLFVAFTLVTNSGCALLGAALSAGASYAIYQATTHK